MNRSSRITRRGFLHHSAAGVVSALTLPVFIPRHVLGSTTAPGANEQIVLGIVGMGQRGNQLLGNIPDSGRVAAICDADSRKTAKTTKTQQADWNVYQDYRKMLDQRDLDAVIVCACDHHHVLAGMLACRPARISTSRNRCRSTFEKAALW